MTRRSRRRRDDAVTGEVGELDARRVAWGGGRAPAAEPYDLAVVGRRRALACPATALRAIRSRASRSAAPPSSADVDAERAA